MWKRNVKVVQQKYRDIANPVFSQLSSCVSPQINRFVYCNPFIATHLYFHLQIIGNLKHVHKSNYTYHVVQRMNINYHNNFSDPNTDDYVGRLFAFHCINNDSRLVFTFKFTVCNFQSCIWVWTLEFMLAIYRYWYPTSILFTFQLKSSTTRTTTLIWWKGYKSIGSMRSTKRTD